MIARYLDLLKACRRSRVKQRVLAALYALRIALPTELADAAATTQERVEAVMHGDDQDYRKTSSLVALGVARQQRGPHGAYEITERGAEAWPEVRARLQQAMPRG